MIERERERERIDIFTIRYAKDTAILADNIGDLQYVLYSLNLASRALSLKMNIKKTKSLVISKDDNPGLKLYTYIVEK